MNDEKALEIIDQIFKGVFNRNNTYSIDEITSKFAYDVKIPQEAIDFSTGEITWVSDLKGNKYMTQDNTATKESWMLPKQEVSSLEEILELWQSVNIMTSERVYESINVAKSDCIYNSENIYRSCDCNENKNMILCNGSHHSEYILACQRTGYSNFCIKVDDSANCSNSYNVECSGKISNSMFIQDCNDLYECIFCSHISNKKFCIANMQFEEQEYYKLKEKIIDWILLIN